MNIQDCWVLYCQKSVMMIGAVCVLHDWGKADEAFPYVGEKFSF